MTGLTRVRSQASEAVRQLKLQAEHGGEPDVTCGGLSGPRRRALQTVAVTSAARPLV